MPRIARLVAVGYPHHVIQRGKPAGSPANRGKKRQKVFFARATREKYLDLLKEYSKEWDVTVLAYCHALADPPSEDLMDNHVHLMLKPQKPESLAKLMQGVTLSYTKYRNRRYHKTGRLWESRYYSCIIDAEDYLWTVARYIEQNPVHAGIVKKAEDYPYSSARAHITAAQDEVLNEELVSAEERADYIKLIRSIITEKEAKFIRLSTKKGLPLGSDSFLKEIEGRLKVSFKNKKSGRPKK